jgi:hypothetical protein
MRSGLGGEQARLLGVRAEAARDDQVQPGLAAGGRGHSVECARDVGPHGFALPVGKRTAVAAAAGLAGERFSAGSGRELGGGAGADRDPGAAASAVRPNARLATGDHRHARRSEGAVGEAHVGAPDSDPIATRRHHGRSAGEREVGREREMVRVRGAALEVGRLEQTRIDVGHRPGRRHGG